MSEIDRRPETVASLEELPVIDRAAKLLFGVMERLDPTTTHSWDGIPDDNKEFYRAAITGLMDDPALIREILDHC